MVEEKDGWFVVNVKDARWVNNPNFGRRVSFEKEGEPFPQMGVSLAILEPGKPNCRYHRESAQENFLVLSGSCRFLVNGQERTLQAWDFVHCPPGNTHVFVGAGQEPCVVLMMGTRPAELFYPHLEAARAVGAQAPEPTPEPRVAYSDVPRFQPIPAPAWPLKPGER